MYFTGTLTTNGKDAGRYHFTVWVQPDQFTHAQPGE